DRRFLPVVIGAVQTGRTAGEPLYCLATAGAAIVAEARGLSLRRVPHTEHENATGFTTIEHHLVVTDLLVALAVACRLRPDPQLMSIDREHALRVRLGRWREHGERDLAVLPDGAFTLSIGGRAQTFYIEVARAGVRGGNQHLLP